MSLLSVKKCVLGRTALLPISVPLPASKRGMDHNQIQALGHLIPPAHSFPPHAGMAGHRTAWNGHPSIWKLAVFGKGVRLWVFAEKAVTESLPSSSHPSRSWAWPSSFADVPSDLRVLVRTVSSTGTFPGF